MKKAKAKKAKAKPAKEAQPKGWAARFSRIPCALSGRMFQPTGPRSQYCHICKECKEALRPRL